MTVIDPASMQLGESVEIGTGPWGAEMRNQWAKYEEFAIKNWPVQFETARQWRNFNGQQQEYHVLTRVR